MDPKCMLTSTDLQTRRARCQHRLSFLLPARKRGTCYGNVAGWMGGWVGHSR